MVHVWVDECGHSDMSLGTHALHTRLALLFPHILYSLNVKTHTHTHMYTLGYRGTDGVCVRFKGGDRQLSRDPRGSGVEWLSSRDADVHT